MRVLHVIAGVAPRYGGPSTALLPMCRAVADTGVSVEVATTDADGPGGRLRPEDLPRTEVPVHLFRCDFSEQWKYSRGLGRWLRQYAGGFDLIHVHGVWSYSTRAACTAARRAGVPVVLRPCGMLLGYSLARSAWKKRLYWSLVEARNLRAVARFHATSQAEAEELKALDTGIGANVISIGLDDAAWSVPRQPEELRRLCGPTAGDRPIVLFLSRLHPKKGVTDLLLPAFAKLTGRAFLAVVGGPDEHEPGYAAEVAHTVSALNLRDHVALVGAVPAAQRWALYDGADLFVLPSHSENFGVVVIEAMARGAPIVVSKEVHAAEFVGRAGAGKLVPLDVDALAEALSAVLDDPAGRQRMGHAGREFARQHFNWAPIGRQIRAMYDDVFAGRGR